MKKLVTLLVLACSFNSFAQIIMFDETDEFNGTRTVSIRNSQSEEISLDDSIIVDSPNYVFLSMDINISKDKKESLTRFILGLVSEESKCYEHSELQLLFESGEVKIVKQQNDPTCDVVAAVGYALSDQELAFLQSNKLEKIRVSHVEGKDDYIINPEHQQKIQETCKLAYTQLKKMRK